MTTPRDVWIKPRTGGPEFLKAFRAVKARPKTFCEFKREMIVEMATILGLPYNDGDFLPVGPCAALRTNLRAWAEDHPRLVAFGLPLLYIAASLALAVAMALAVRRAEGAGRAVWRVTAYCPCKQCCGAGARGITASGTRADHPLVAAPPEIPFGTVLTIPGYADGAAVRVEDRGGAIRGRRLDVCMYLAGRPLEKSHEKAMEWGVRYIELELP